MISDRAYPLPRLCLPPCPDAGVHDVAKLGPEAVLHPGVGPQGEEDCSYLASEAVEDGGGQVSQHHRGPRPKPRPRLLEHVDLEPPVHWQVPADHHLNQGSRNLVTCDNDCHYLQHSSF